MKGSGSEYDKMKQSSLFFPILFVIGLFFILISPHFLSDGMFLDGLWYATLSKNLAEGFGSFWMPRLTQTYNAWGQPPLAYLLESVFFHFGKSLYVAKIYSVFTCLCTGVLMFLTWKEVGGKRENFWMVLLLWIATPLVSWCAPENVLENTMVLFTLLSVLFYLRSLRKNHILNVVLDGIMLFLALLTKGFTGLYPLAFPVIHMLFVRKTTPPRALADTLIMLACVLLPVTALYLFSPEAKLFMQNYLSEQLLTSLKYIQTVNTRFDIVLQFFTQALLPLAIVGVVLLVAWMQKTLHNPFRDTNRRLTWALLALVLTGVLPIMISLKQRGFYIVTVFPLFALAAGIAIEPLLENIRTSPVFTKISKGISVVVLMAAIALNIHFAGKAGRDENLLADIRLASSQVPEDTILSADKTLYTLWSMPAYFYFEKKISLDFDSVREWHLDGINAAPPDSSYLLCAKGSLLQLFRKQD